MSFSLIRRIFTNLNEHERSNPAIQCSAKMYSSMHTDIKSSEKKKDVQLSPFRFTYGSSEGRAPSRFLCELPSCNPTPEFSSTLQKPFTHDTAPRLGPVDDTGNAIHLLVCH